MATPADIAIYGGAAGSGKTFAELLEPLRHYNNSRFGAVVFRRTLPEIMNEGGLWDTSKEIYTSVGGHPKLSPRPMWTFPSGMRVSFAQLENDEACEKWKSSQIPLIIYDELTTFTRYQFFYMLSRNRSTCGVKPYIRAGTNPDADSWVAKFIEWWWDPQTGYPIPERSGKIRYMIRRDEEIIWADSPQELMQRYPDITIHDIKSVTFIAASIYDNKKLLEINPQYLANLKALPRVERERLLHGNWKIRKAAGLYFKREQVQMLEVLPTDVVAWCRRWDLAATAPTEEQPNPDATAGVLIGRRSNGRYIVADVIRKQVKASDVRSAIKNTAAADKAKYGRVKIVIPQDPGQAGKEQYQSYATMLSGYVVAPERETNDKITRAEPFAAQWQAGNVDVLIAPWNEMYFNELEAFPEGGHDDMVDASAGAYNNLQTGIPATTPSASEVPVGRSYWTAMSSR